MTIKKTTIKDIDEYIAGFPDEIREILEMLRMKVNKITSTTSLDEFNRFAKNVVAAL